MPKIIVERRSFDVTSGELRKFLTERTPAAQRAALARAGGVLAGAMRQNLSIPPIGGSPSSHAAALAALDHPYARRRSSIRLTPEGGYPGFRRRRLLVHTVSGRLLSALTTRLDAGGGLQGDAEFSVGVDLNRAPHAEYVFRGTQVMHPRDTLWATATDPGVKAAVRKVLIDELRRVMRL